MIQAVPRHFLFAPARSSKKIGDNRRRIACANLSSMRFFGGACCIIARQQVRGKFREELLIEDGGKDMCGVGERTPAALSTSPPSPLPRQPRGAIVREKIYGHANYPLKLRETNLRSSAHLLRRPRARGAPPLPRTLKIRPIKLFEKLRRRTRPAEASHILRIIGRPDYVSQLSILRSCYLPAVDVMSRNFEYSRCHNILHLRVFIKHSVK
jgi:hypothetical protein